MPSVSNPSLRIRTTTGVEATGFVNVSLYRAPLVRVSFILGLAPHTTVSQGTPIDRLEFDVINFPRGFGGNADKYVLRRGTGIRRGGSIVHFRDFTIRITERLSEPWRSRKNPDGYSLTHTGVLRRKDRKPLAVSDAEKVLRRFRSFLSFLRGVQCGIAPVRAIVGGQKTAFRWGSNHVVPEPANRENWLPTHGGAAIALFPEFDRFCEDPGWGETLIIAVDLYTNASTSAGHVALVLAQAALETLSHKILNSAEWAKSKRDAPRRIRFLLARFGIDPGIPKELPDLESFSSSNGGRDGPAILVYLRNAMIHRSGEFHQAGIEVQIQAMRLAQWYVEMALLKRLGFSGRYFDRIRNEHSDL